MTIAMRRPRRPRARQLSDAENGVKISMLPAAAGIGSTDQFEINQAGTSRRGTADLIGDYVAARAAAANALDYGLSTTATGLENSQAMERALAAARIVHVPEGVYNVDVQYDGTTSGATTRKICIRVPTNRTILGPGTLQYTTPQPTVVPNRLVAILSIVGSNVRIGGLTLNDAHNSLVIPPATYGSVCRANGIVCGDGEDPIVTYDISNITVDDCTFTNNFYPLFFRVKASSPTVISDFRIMNCRGIAHPLSGFSGGFTTFGMNPNFDPAHPPIRNGVMAFNLMRGARTSAGLEFAGQTGGIMIGNVAEDCWYAGFETEGGAEEITFVGNRAIRCGNPFWTNDSQRIAFVGNIGNTTTTPLAPGAATVQNGILIGRGGFSGTPDYQTAEVVVVANILANGKISLGTVGSAGGSFGAITIVGNDIRHTDPADMPSACIILTSGGPRIIMGNALQGGDDATISMSSAEDQPTVIVGNITRAAGAEPSVGITGVDITPMELVHGFNAYLNGIGGLVGQVAGFGNRDAATVTRPLSQAGHRINYGSGNPETMLDGTISDLYQRYSDPAGPLWVKTSGYPVPIGEPLDYVGWKPLQMLVSGTTAERPNPGSGGHVGFRYYDTTLGKPIWWNGGAWKDATGATV